ncbi:hypothetical protein JDN40_09565 [Rhodomicrobium vannielii ATCC 17100]|uniref:hypothetical protein n=1 Tax=Rhodomicrobium vannielii TaxID=1069 RepID=UPI0019184ADC|nr:hypothetical protein [Rhodomicrobium vannielii]MBJ7534349.1 hypothetical protein [Rhodomicrobium vannielii ATCC 17100]
MADEFDNSWDINVKGIKKIFAEGSSADIYGFVQWLLRNQSCPIAPTDISVCLTQGGSAYRLLDDDKTLFPITTSKEAKELNRILESDEIFADALFF